MTELQIGLIGLGVAAVAGVVAYNKWQEYRHRKVAESVLKPHADDVLLDPQAKRANVPRPAAGAPARERHEPVFHQEPLHDVPPDPLEDSSSQAELGAEIPGEEASSAPAADAAVELPWQETAPEIQAPIQAPAAHAVPEPSPAPTKSAVSELPRAVIDVPLPAALLDPRIEFIVAMELVEPVSSHQILSSQRTTLQRIAKPVHWVGFNDKTHEWVRLRGDHDIPVRRLRVGLQLVNRLGPVSDVDLATFTGAMQALADELMAVADMPPSRVLDQAAEIDRFCAAVDLEIGLNLVTRGLPFAGTKIRALAEAAGMVLGMDGMFTRHDEDGKPMFSLQNLESTTFSAEGLRTLTTHGITFLLDVPRVEHGESVFVQMVAQAQRFAETLQGTLVDDNRNPLGEAQLDHIRREFIGKPQATMRSFGLPGGSPQALRLFS